MQPLIRAVGAIVVSWSVSAVGSPEPSGAVGSTVETPRVTIRGTEQREFDWAKLQARARVASVSSGPKTLAGRMIDDDLRTVFRFSASDNSPTVIVELAQAERLHRISAVFKADQARLDVFLLDRLPKDPRDLGATKPFASIADTGKDPGRASVDFSPNSARYVALRWTRIKSNEPFEVAEISAFSDEPTDWESETPGHLADTNGITSGDLVSDPPPIVVASP